MLHLAFRRSRLAVFVSLLSVLISGAAFAQADNPSPAGHFTRPAKDLFAAASAVPADGANIAILEDDDSFSFDEQGRMTHVGYTVYKVLTEKGAEAWDSISIGWEPWHEARPEIKVRVITPDFVEHALDQKNVNEAPAHEGDYKIYSDGKRLHAPFPAISAGVVVEEEYRERETEPLFAAGRSGWTTFGREDIPVQHSRLEFDAPASLPLRTATLLLEIKPQRIEANGAVKLIYDVGRLEGVVDGDPNFPSDVARFPQVSYSTGASWQVMAMEYSKLVDSRAGAAAVQSIVDGLVAGKTTAAAKESALLDYLDRNVRYTGIEFGGEAIIPHEPAETLGKRYGDCKDKATLLVTMLRAAGIPSYVALLNAGSRMDVPADLPGMGLFDHAIVYVPAIAASGSQPATPAVWIDATDRYARLGQLPIADQGRMSLIARAETTALTQIPLAASKVNTLLEFRTVTLSENGPATVLEKTQPKGVYESRYRSYYADKPDKDTRDNLSGYVKTQYVSENLTTVDRTDPADLGNQFELTVACEKAKRGYTSLSGASAAIRYEPLFFRLPDELTEKEDAAKDKKNGKPARTSDWELIEPYVVDLNYRIVPPPGFVPKELPRNTTMSLGPGTLMEEFSTASDGAVLAHLTFDTVKRRYTVDEANELRAKVTDLTSGPAIMISFKSTFRSVGE